MSGMKDMTQGSVTKHLLHMASFMAVSMVVQTLYLLADLYWVGRLGKEAIAAVGLSGNLMMVVLALTQMLGVGTTTVISHAAGRKDQASAERAFNQSVVLSLVVGLLFGIVSFPLRQQYSQSLSADAPTAAMAVSYLGWFIPALILQFPLVSLGSALRATGIIKPAVGLQVLSVILNMIFAPLLIFGVGPFPELGVVGAAVGTTIGRGCGVLFAAWCLFRPGGRIHVDRESWRFDPTLLWKLVKLSSTGVFQLLIATASWTALMPIMAGFGEVAIAGYVIALRVVMFALLPALGLSNAAATMVGQNLGAGKPERSEAAVWKAGWFNAVFYFGIGVIFWLFSNQIIGIFTDEAEVLRYGTSALHIIAYGFAFYGLGMVLETAFNGAGDTWTPTYLNFFVFWLFEIPAAYILAYYYGLGPDGVFWAITIAFSLLAVASALLFKRGKWKLKVV